MYLLYRISIWHVAIGIIYCLSCVRVYCLVFNIQIKKELRGFCSSPRKWIDFATETLCLSCILIMGWQTMSRSWIISSMYHLFILWHDLNDWWVTVSLSVSVREEPSWVSAGFRKLCQEVAHSSIGAFYPITAAATLQWTGGLREPKFYCFL